METRKITSLGKYSLVITLPKYWLKENKLKRGDKVALSVQPDLSLVVHPTMKVGERKKEIDLIVESEEGANSIIRRIIGCYLNGYTIIRLRSGNIFTVEQQRAIRSIVQSVYMRIIESTASSAIIQTLMDESMASVISGLERMHIITSSMCQDVLNSMKNWNEELAKSVVSLEDDVDQFMFYLLRLIRAAASNPSLAQHLGIDMTDCLDIQTLVHRIEHVGDHTTNIANRLITLIESKADIPTEVFSILIKAAEIAFNSYDKAVQSFLSKDVSYSNEIIEKQGEIEKLGESITPMPYFGEREETRTIFQICNIRESIRRISEYAADIAEITIDRTYKLASERTV